MLARVSNLEAFRRWREDDEQSVEDLVRFITVDEPTPAMRAGTAFHLALEHTGVGEFHEFLALDHHFHLVGDGRIEMPAVRECRAYKRYGDLTVTGQVDGIAGRTVWDHKTTSRFEAERYLAGFQWRFYLDLFGANVFHWNVFEIKETGPLVYDVAEPHLLTAYRYPGMEDDCRSLTADYAAFAREHLTEQDVRIAA